NGNGNGQPAAHTSAGPQPSELTAVSEQAAQPISDEQLKAVLSDLKTQCRRGADPAYYVETLCLHDEWEPYRYVGGLILNKEFDYFVGIDPEINQAPYAGWFKAIFDGYRSAYRERNPVDADSARKGGNDGNSKHDAKAGKGSVKKS